MSSLTATLITAMYLTLLGLEVLSLTIVGDLSLFLCLRLLNTAQQALCRYLRHSVGEEGRKRAFFTNLLLRLLYTDVVTWGSCSMLMVAYSSRSVLVILLPILLTAVGMGQVWHEYKEKK
jgi:hypothetical protein